MASTPAGSWAACPHFGLRDLFENGRQRADIPRLATERTNQALADLGILHYRVSEVVREVNPRLDTDVYTVTLTRTSTTETFSTSIQTERG